MNEKQRTHPLNAAKHLTTAFAVTAMFFAPIALAQPTTQHKVDAWLADLKARAEQRLTLLKSEVDHAQAVLEQALNAKSKAIELNDQRSMPIALQAVTVATEAKERADDNYLRLVPMVEGFRTISSVPPVIKPSEAMPVLLTGKVWVQRSNRWAPLTLTERLQPGDNISTGERSAVLLRFNDDLFIQMGPNSTFELRTKTKGEEFYNFLEGRLHIYTPSWMPGKVIHYQSPTVLVSERGTEFSIRLDEQGLSHLELYEGKVGLTTDEKKTKNIRLGHWWKIGKPVALPAPLEGGQLLRIVSVEGEALIVGTDGVSRTASVGSVLANGDNLKTGDSSVADVELVGGHRASVAANSRFEVGQDSSGKPLYTIWQGRLYVSSRSAKESNGLNPTFVTPNAMASAKRAEFEISVGEDGLADFVVLSGSMEVTARIEKLDMDKIKPWWSIDQ